MLLNITVTILFIGILVTFTFNLYAGFSLMGIALVTAIGGLAYITYKEISAKSSKIMLCILFILVTILNPSFMLGVIPLRTEILDLYYVDNKEMQPTLQPGSFLLIDKISGLLRSPTLQDIILTRSPANKTKINLITKVFRHFKSTPNSFIRRVIGTPGDRIRVNNDNRVFLNNNFLSEPFIRKSKNYQLCDYVYYCNIEKVPASHFYLLGDNRAATQDSRIWSTVDKRLFQGKIFAILWPRNKTKTFP